MKVWLWEFVVWHIQPLRMPSLILAVSYIHGAPISQFYFVDSVSISWNPPPPFFQENLTVVWPYYCSPKKWLFLLIQTKTKAFRFPWVCAFANVSTPAWSVLLVLSFLFTKNLSGRNRFLPKWRPSYDHLSYIHINLQSTLSRYLCSVTLLLRQYTTLCPFKLFAEHIKQAFWDLS